MDRAPRVIVCDSHRDQPPHARPEDAGAAPGGGPGGERMRAAEAPARVDLHHLPAGAEHFLGRGPELAALDAAWTPAGAAEIRPDDPELIAATQEVNGHALALSLLGRYLARGKGGDIRRRDTVDPARADRDARGHAARVVAAYETWFAREGEAGARELAALRLLGFFDRPRAATYSTPCARPHPSPD